MKMLKAPNQDKKLYVFSPLSTVFFFVISCQNNSFHKSLNIMMVNNLHLCTAF